MNIPKNVDYILKRLWESEFKAHIVGGCVRDYILGIVPTDFDITTDALPQDIKNIFEHTVDTGIQHGTVSVVIEKSAYEITTYRIDGEYKDNRHPENVTFTKYIKDDLCRRDFTVNAIAYNEKDGFIDYFDGIYDIKSKIIRGVGDADTRFKEDALRMIRGVRFCAKLGFDIEKNTLLAIKQNASLLKNVSMERIRDEFFKMITAKYIEKMILLYETNLYKYFMESMQIFFLNFGKNIFIMKNISPKIRFIFLLSLFNESERKKVCKYFDISSKVKNEIKITLNYINYNFEENILHTKMLMSKVNPDILKQALSIKFAINLADKNLVECKKCDNIYDEIDEVIRKNHCYNLKGLDINGEDIKKMGVKNGQEIGKALQICLMYAIKNPSKNNKKQLIIYLKEKIEGGEIL